MGTYPGITVQGTYAAAPEAGPAAGGSAGDRAPNRVAIQSLQTVRLTVQPDGTVHYVESPALDEVVPGVHHHPDLAVYQCQAAVQRLLLTALRAVERPRASFVHVT